MRIRTVSLLARPSQWSRRTLISATTALATVFALGGVGAATATAASHSPLAESATRAADTTTTPMHLTPFTVVSPDFRDGGPLPVWTEFGGQYASEAGCFGKNLAPELDWRNAPSGTQSFALLVNDMDAPNAGGWHHYVVYDIPGGVTELPGHGVHLYTEGQTSWDTNGIPNVGWGGPCPPADGSTHHYIFTLYALSAASLSTSGLTYEQVLNEITPSVLGSTVIIGTFHLPL